MRRKTVFLDRDGVLNVDCNYLYRTEDFVWVEGAKEAVRYLNEQGYLVIVITNQSGVARGYYTEEDVDKLHNWMSEQLDLIGARIDAFYYCPHHPEGKLDQYRTSCVCRKPEPGLILQAIEEWSVDTAASFMVGDNIRDVEAGESAGVKSYLYKEGNLLEFVRKIVHL